MGAKGSKGENGEGSNGNEDVFAECESEPQGTVVTAAPEKVPAEVGVGPQDWTMGKSLELQKIVDELFGGQKIALAQIEFSFSIGDPTLPDCPLVGCSAGFSRLTGYSIQDILGVSCRILLNGVPPEMINQKAREWARELCATAKLGKQYRMPEEDREDWMPPGPFPKGEAFCVQTNARRDGTLFKNMFYMKQVELDDHPYILGLQGEMPEELLDQSDHNTTTKGMGDVQRKTMSMLESSMDKVEVALARFFFYDAPIRSRRGKPRVGN